MSAAIEFDNFIKRRPTEPPLSWEEMHALYNACGRGARGHRDRAMLVLLWRCGMRAGEVVSQTIPDLLPDGERMRVRVSNPKGYQRGTPKRIIGLDARSRRVIDTWLAVREERHGRIGRLVAGTDIKTWVFPTRNGGKMATQHLRRWLPMLASRAGIKRRVHPHCLRATFACDLYNEEVGMREIQVALGHVSLATTETYLRSIGADAVVAATQRRIWQW